jgi:hypothetical protein
MRNTAIALALLIAGPASAGDMALLDRAAISGIGGHFSANGVAAPAAASDVTTGEMLVAYETALAAPDASCPTGVYAIGIAASIDGRSWTHTPAPVLGPDADFPCGVRAPAITVSTDGEVNVYGERVSNTGGSDAGIIEVALDGLEPLYAPSLVLAHGGSPSVIRIGDVDEMIFTLDGDLYGASRNIGGGWVTSDAPVLHAGISDWNGDGLSSPSLSCANGGDFAWELHYTGSGNDERGYTWGWASAVSDTGSFWFVDPSGPYLQRRSGSAPELAVVRTITNNRVVFVELPSRGGPVIAIASDSGSWSPSQVAPLHCTP